MSREEFDLAVMLLEWKVIQRSYIPRVGIAIHTKIIWLPTLFTPRLVHIVTKEQKENYSDKEYQSEQEAYEMTIKLIGEFKDENR